jgi:hypothetical protein
MFIDSHTTYFYYYIKGSNASSNKWLRYKFVHTQSKTTNADSWNQTVVDAVEQGSGTWTVLYPVVTGGEWEMGIRILGAVDAIGGRTHGSEVNTYCKFFVNGITWIPGNETFWCDEIKIIEKSNMYDPNDEVTLVATHIKDYRITADGIRLKQKINWLTNQTIYYGRMCMLPIIRGNDALSAYQITEYAYNDDTFEAIDVSAAGHSASTKNYKANKWTLYSDATGISAVVENTFSPRLPESSTFIYGIADEYNKVYFNYGGAVEVVAIGDTWASDTTYKLNIGT